MKDTHPRVRYAAVYAAGQLCTDLDGAIQDEHGQELLTALMGVTNEREPRCVFSIAHPNLFLIQLYAVSKRTLPPRASTSSRQPTRDLSSLSFLPCLLSSSDSSRTGRRSSSRTLSRR